MLVFPAMLCHASPMLVIHRPVTAQTNTDTFIRPLPTPCPSPSQIIARFKPYKC